MCIKAVNYVSAILKEILMLKDTRETFLIHSNKHLSVARMYNMCPLIHLENNLSMLS